MSSLSVAQCFSKYAQTPFYGTATSQAYGAAKDEFLSELSDLLITSQKIENTTQPVISIPSVISKKDIDKPRS